MNTRSKKRHVTFEPGIKTPIIRDRCKCCGHRNIRPRNREMFWCGKCKKCFCVNCIDLREIPRGGDAICFECSWDFEY